MPKESIFPLTPIERLIKKGGAERVSASATRTLREILEDMALNIANIARDLAEHAGRKTVTAEDIKLAYKQLK
ncbi:MAG: histone family protein [Candidatus Baldrarchaeia archaeon]